MFSKQVAMALAAVVALSSSSRTGNAFSNSIDVHVVRGHQQLRATNEGLDTDTVLPFFSTKEEYTAYLQKAGRLPDGFAVGTAKGSFVSVEAPALGPLPIKATVIYLTEGATESWAAVFTSNRVSVILL